MNTLLPSPPKNNIGICFIKRRPILGNLKSSFKEGFSALKIFLDKQTDLSKAIANIEGGNDVPEQVKESYLDIKQQAIAYYLSSEEVATKFLNYLPVPGPYVPCITLEEAGGKAWAL